MPRTSENAETNYLPASGFTKTSTAIHEWAGKVVKEARSLFGDQPIRAHVWAYRESGCHYLSCDLFSGEKALPVTLCVCNESYLPEIMGGAAEADVWDMPDALHLAGIITKALTAEIDLGRGQNEVNDQVLEKPRASGETNGPIALNFSD